jgi:serine 3-dehydrogenase
MIDLRGTTVFITGASSGIGASCAMAFARAGARLILCARRAVKLQEVVRMIRENRTAEVHAFVLDVRERAGVERAVEALPPAWREIDILVNNAGLSRGLDKLHEGSIDDWEEMLDTNVKGLLYISRAVIPGMVARGRGTIVNVGSIAGQEVYPGGNVYCASKHAVDAITKGLRMDLVDTPLRVCTIDPGLVETEFSLVRYHGDTERAKKTYNGMTPLGPDDVADAVLYAATRPSHVSINQIVLMPTAQAAATVVHRKTV